MDAELGYMGPVMVFDLDDTLYAEADFVLSGFRAVSHMAIQYRPVTSAETWYQLMKQAWLSGRNAFDALSEEVAPTDTESFIKSCVDTYRFHKPSISLSDSAVLLLSTLAANGIRMSVITDGRSRTQRAKIKSLGLERYIGVTDILISEELGAEKTSINGWRKIVSRYPNASQFIYIGDNPAKDFYWPRRLGWRTFGLRDHGKNIHKQTGDFPPGHMPEIWIDDLSEIISLITKY